MRQRLVHIIRAAVSVVHLQQQGTHIGRFNVKAVASLSIDSGRAQHPTVEVVHPHPQPVAIHHWPGHNLALNAQVGHSVHRALQIGQAVNAPRTTQPVQKVLPVAGPQSRHPQALHILQGGHITTVARGVRQQGVDHPHQRIHIVHRRQLRRPHGRAVEHAVDQAQVGRIHAHHTRRRKIRHRYRRRVGLGRRPNGRQIIRRAERGRAVIRASARHCATGQTSARRQAAPRRAERRQWHTGRATAYGHHGVTQTPQARLPHTHLGHIAQTMGRVRLVRDPITSSVLPHHRIQCRLALKKGFDFHAVGAALIVHEVQHQCLASAAHQHPLRAQARGQIHQLKPHPRLRIQTEGRRLTELQHPLLQQLLPAHHPDLNLPAHQRTSPPPAPEQTHAIRNTEVLSKQLKCQINGQIVLISISDIILSFKATNMSMKNIYSD